MTPLGSILSVLILFVAAILEAGGDALVRAGLRTPVSPYPRLRHKIQTWSRAVMTSRALTVAIAAALFGVFLLLNLALGSAIEALLILCTVPIAFVGGILALLVMRETWNVSSLVGLIGLFGIAVQNSLVLVTQIRGLLAPHPPRPN